MLKAGVEVEEELKSTFREADEDEKKYFFKIDVENEQFRVMKKGDLGDDDEGNFGIVAKQCKAKEPCYLLFKLNAKQGKWLLIFYVPTTANVKKRMMIASSASALTEGLGSSYFCSEYAISEPDECSLDAWTKSVSDDTDCLLSWQEMEKKQTRFDHSMAMSNTKVSAVVGIPIPVSDDGRKVIEDFEARKVNCVIFECDTKNETLNVCFSDKAFKLNDIPGKLPEREPRYILYYFEAEKTNIFVYYCPDKSKPKLRMFYSTAKSNVLSTIAEYKIEEPKRIEISLASELTTQSVQDEIKPKVQHKKIFKKPSKQGRGRAKFHGKKFQALKPS